MRVRVLDAQRAEAIEDYGRALGIDAPLVGDTLRQTSQGRCVFLDETNLCRIHAQYGADAKPLICRQYPIVGVQTESGARRGIDPGCYSAFHTQSSPVITPNEPFAWAKSDYPEPLENMEQALLSVLSVSGQTIHGVLARLAGQPDGQCPTGFVDRVKQRVAHPDFVAAATHPSAGPAVRRGLEPIVSAVQNQSSWGDGPTPSAVFEAWALEATRRVIWLRLCPNMPSPMVACLLSLTGAIVVTQVMLEENAQVSGFTAWTRAMRSPMFWGHFFPDINAVQWLLRG